MAIDVLHVTGFVEAGIEKLTCSDSFKILPLCDIFDAKVHRGLQPCLTSSEKASLRPHCNSLQDIRSTRSAGQQCTCGCSLSGGQSVVTGFHERMQLRCTAVEAAAGNPGDQSVQTDAARRSQHCLDGPAWQLHRYGGSQVALPS